MMVGLAMLLSLTNWRWGLFLCVLVGILQDPLRKLAPDQPVYFVVLVGIVFGAAWLGALLAKVRLRPGSIEGWTHNMGRPFGLFLALVALQAFQSYARFDSLRMTGIGAMVWLAPIPAVVLAYQFAIRRGLIGLRRLIIFYCLVAMVSLSGVYLEYSGYDWGALGEVGRGLKIYDVGTVLKAYSGFFRSSEIAAWHTATISIFIFMMFTARRVTLTRLLAALVLIGILLAVGILTGRRKMLVEVGVFLSAYFFLVAWFQRGASRLAVSIALGGVVVWVSAVGLMNPDELDQRSGTKNYQLAQGERYKGYAVRGQSVFEDVPNRFANLGVAPISWAVNSFGWFGAGLGTGSQRGEGVEDVANINQGAAEGGLGKITMELGVPGLVLMVWMLVALARYLRRILVFTTLTSRPHARMAYGLVALLVAKAASFSVAAQAYSDLFILLIVGWTLGFILAMPVLAARSSNADRKHREDRPRFPSGYAEKARESGLSAVRHATERR